MYLPSKTYLVMQSYAGWTDYQILSRSVHHLLFRNLARSRTISLRPSDEFSTFFIGYHCTLSVGFAVLKVATTNSLTIVAGESNRGEVFGVAGSITSLLRGAVPLLCSLPGIVASVSVAVLAILSVFFVPLPIEEEA